MLRAPALSSLKEAVLDLFALIKKTEKAKKVRKGSKKIIDEDKSEF
mgnify:CR=1 FL=1